MKQSPQFDSSLILEVPREMELGSDKMESFLIRPSVPMVSPIGFIYLETRVQSRLEMCLEMQSRRAE